MLSLSTSNINVSLALPPKPIVFRGRDKFVNTAVELLTGPGTARIAILGPGGVGKTAVALTLLHDSRVTMHFPLKRQRLFLSCEVFVEADDIVVSLAKLLGLPASDDLLTSVMTRLADTSNTVLVLDNLETIWLSGGAPVVAVDELLGKLANLSSLSLVITCRGVDLPRFVEWSNSENPNLEQLSLEAARETFEDRAGRHFSGSDEQAVERLVGAVGGMPLAMSLLGQLVRHGNTPSELLDRWNHEHSALLQTHAAGRQNNVDVSVKISISMMRAADDSDEPLQLLSLSSMLPDGIRPPVLDRLRPKFRNIGRARDTLSAYGLGTVGMDGVLTVPNHIRHLVLQYHPSSTANRNALFSIYLEIASQLPDESSGYEQTLLDEALSEMGNLTSLLLLLVAHPTQQVVTAVIRFTQFARFYRPATTLVTCLLQYLEPHPKWKAESLRALGSAQFQARDRKSAIVSFAHATRLFLEIGEPVSAACCKENNAHVQLQHGQSDEAELLLEEARATYSKYDYKPGLANVCIGLATLMMAQNSPETALQHGIVARQTFDSLGYSAMAAHCSNILGNIYFGQGNLDSAVEEFESARMVYQTIGNGASLGMTTCYLGTVRRVQCDFTSAEKLLCEAEHLLKANGQPQGIAYCALQLGALRQWQKRNKEALAYFKYALTHCGTPDTEDTANLCRQQIAFLESQGFWFVVRLIELLLLISLIAIFRVTVH